MAPEYKDYVTTALDMYSVGKTIEETLKYSNICPNMYTMIDMLTRTSPYERFGTKEAFRLLSTMRSEQSELEAAASMAVTNKGKLNAQQPVASVRQGNENEVFMSDLFDMFKQLKQDTAVLKKDNDTLKQHNEALNHKIDAMEKGHREQLTAIKEMLEALHNKQMHLSTTSKGRGKRELEAMNEMAPNSSKEGKKKAKIIAKAASNTSNESKKRKADNAVKINDKAVSNKKTRASNIDKEAKRRDTNNHSINKTAPSVQASNCIEQHHLEEADAQQNRKMATMPIHKHKHLTCTSIVERDINNQRPIRRCRRVY
ncbi:hypothetical protein BDF19DRAFT_455249 [Syncephalis fuscata]|nr:hypothetical protein BDF19DRAFT_455249 [Syncephalis fuscata]